MVFRKGQAAASRTGAAPAGQLRARAHQAVRPFLVEHYVYDLQGTLTSAVAALGLDRADRRPRQPGHAELAGPSAATGESRPCTGRDVTFREDSSQVRTGSCPRVMATLRNHVIGLIRFAGHNRIAPVIRQIRHSPPLLHAILGLHQSPSLPAMNSTNDFAPHPAAVDCGPSQNKSFDFTGSINNAIPGRSKGTGPLDVRMWISELGQAVTASQTAGHQAKSGCVQRDRVPTGLSPVPPGTRWSQRRHTAWSHLPE
jgi:hypothetical protein